MKSLFGGLERDQSLLETARRRGYLLTGIKTPSFHPAQAELDEARSTSNTMPDHWIAPLQCA